MSTNRRESKTGNSLDECWNPLFEPAKLKQFQKSLLAWYDRHKRDLPWRESASLKNRSALYRVWLSEIMLQQTQVDTVIPYYKRFLKAFPNIQRLAKARIDDVLKFWEGLGYYRRARSLHAAAQQILDKHGGRFPANYADVIALPGIGRYTAGAILSIGADQRLPVLEGNTIRLHARLLDLHADVKQTSTHKTLWEFAESILPVERCGDFNQALMELGNQICTPKKPACHSCPVSRLCQGFARDSAAQLPFNSAKQRTEELFESLFVIGQRGKMLIRKCMAGERWQGMYDFPRLMNLTSRATRGTLNSFVDHELGISRLIKDVEAARLWTTTHYVTKYKINLVALHVDLPPSVVVVDEKILKDKYRWVSEKQLVKLPLNKTARKAFDILRSEKQ